MYEDKDDQEEDGVRAELKSRQLGYRRRQKITVE